MAGFSGKAIPIGLVAAAALAACNPIDTWRNINGISKNDPAPDAPYGRQLAEGEALAYPNLASVPPPPTGELTAAERQKLARSLVDERGSAQASDRQLRATHPAPPSAAAPAHPASNPAAAGGAAGPAEDKQVTAAPSAEASLDLPQLPPPPQPEAFTPAPPPPHLGAPAVAAATGPRIAAGPMPAAMATAGYQPPPAIPTLPLPPPTQAAAKPAPKPPPAPPTLERIGEVAFAPGSLQPSGGQPVVNHAVAAYVAASREGHGRIRVVGHAGRTEGSIAQMDSYRAALDRAQAVAAALTRRGIPADKIRVEAAPTAADAGPARAEVLLER